MHWMLILYAVSLLSVALLLLTNEQVRLL